MPYRKPDLFDVYDLAAFRHYSSLLQFFKFLYTACRKSVALTAYITRIHLRLTNNTASHVTPTYPTSIVFT